ncbi:MAG: VOC family protein [Actinocatenispora sp.]
MGLHIGMVTIDCADPRRLAEFWSAALNAPTVLDVGEFVMLGPAGDGEPAVGLQRVPEERAGKNRIHVDLRAEDGQAEIVRLVGLGATTLGEHSVPGQAWTVLADPEGNQFCVGTGTGD